MLAKNRLNLPIAYIWAAGDVEFADQHLAALDELGAPTGYLIDVLTEDDESIKKQIAEAGIVILGDGPNLETLRSGVIGAVADGLKEAHTRGVAIVGVGAGASVLGSLTDRERRAIGLLEGALIKSGYIAEVDSENLHHLLTLHPDCYGLGIGGNSALALGPDGEVETWGKRQITIALPKQYR